MYIQTYTHIYTKISTAGSSLAAAEAAADGAMNSVVEKCSIFWRSFWESVACCRTKHEWLHGQSLTCQQALSSQHLQTQTDVHRHDTHTHTHPDVWDRETHDWLISLHTHEIMGLLCVVCLRLFCVKKVMRKLVPYAHTRIRCVFVRLMQQTLYKSPTHNSVMKPMFSWFILLSCIECECAVTSHCVYHVHRLGLRSVLRSVMSLVLAASYVQVLARLECVGHCRSSAHVYIVEHTCSSGELFRVSWVLVWR